MSVCSWCCRAAKTSEKASDGDKPAEKEAKEATALAIAADPEVSDDSSIDLSTYRSSVDQVKAIATKISTARRLARKLAAEKSAVAAMSDGDPREAELCDFAAFVPCLRLRGPPSGRAPHIYRVFSYPVLGARSKEHVLQTDTKPTAWYELQDKA